MLLKFVRKNFKGQWVRLDMRCPFFLVYCAAGGELLLSRIEIDVAHNERYYFSRGNLHMAGDLENKKRHDVDRFMVSVMSFIVYGGAPYARRADIRLFVNWTASTANITARPITVLILSGITIIIAAAMSTTRSGRLTLPSI